MAKPLHRRRRIVRRTQEIVDALAENPGQLFQLVRCPVGSAVLEMADHLSSHSEPVAKLRLRQRGCATQRGNTFPQLAIVKNTVTRHEFTNVVRRTGTPIISTNRGYEQH